MNEGAAFLLAVLVGRGTAHEEAAVEVDRDDREPVFILPPRSASRRSGRFFRHEGILGGGVAGILD